MRVIELADVENLRTTNDFNDLFNYFQKQCNECCNNAMKRRLNTEIKRGLENIERRFSPLSKEEYAEMRSTYQCLMLRLNRAV